MTALPPRSSARKPGTGSPRRQHRPGILRACPLFLALIGAAAAQNPSPAHWTLTPSAARVAPGSDLLLELKLDLDAPWHMYSVTTPKPGPEGGPTQTTMRLVETPAVTSWELYFPAPQRKVDPNFQIETETYEGFLKFYLKLHLVPGTSAGPTELTARMRYQLCTDKQCLPPRTVTAATTVSVDASAPKSPVQPPPGFTLFRADAAAPATSGRAAPPNPASNQGLGAFLLLAFSFGFAAIFTPVSYTHLDVYKRQLQRLRSAPVQLRAVPAHGERRGLDSGADVAVHRPRHLLPDRLPHAGSVEGRDRLFARGQVGRRALIPADS